MQMCQTADGIPAVVFIARCHFIRRIILYQAGRNQGTGIGSGMYLPAPCLCGGKCPGKDHDSGSKCDRDGYGRGRSTHLETEGITIMIPNAKPWSAEDPHLYRVRAELVQDGSVLDCDESHFGMRTLAWGKEGFLVNGKEVLFRGACIHHDNGVLGACGFADAETRRVRILKEAGFNAIRSAHNPISKAMLDACDVMGMYVMDETFDMWSIHKNPYDYAGDKFKEWWKADTEAMISKDYNHPSVVMYSIGNEITELGMEDGQKQAKVMVDFLP